MPSHDEKVEETQPIINHQPTFEALSIPISKAKESSEFDDEALISVVPRIYQRKAKHLLQLINKFSTEITWNLSGNLIIDDVSIPLSNIFVLFPILFKKKVKKPDSIPGLLEFVTKLKSKGFESLFNLHLNEVKSESSQKNVFDLNLDKSSKSMQWWYIGD